MEKRPWISLEPSGQQLLQCVAAGFPPMPARCGTTGRLVAPGRLGGGAVPASAIFVLIGQALRPSCKAMKAANGRRKMHKASCWPPGEHRHFGRQARPAAPFLRTLWRLQAPAWASHLGALHRRTPPRPTALPGDRQWQLGAPRARCAWGLFGSWAPPLNAMSALCPSLPQTKPAAHAHNLGKLAQLLPASSAAAASGLYPWRPRLPAHLGTGARGQPRPPAHRWPGAWAGCGLIRPDRPGRTRHYAWRPCAVNLLAAQLHAEPVPLEAALAQLLGTQRLLKHN